MALNPNGFLARWLHNRALARWKAAAQSAGHAEIASLRKLRQQARQLRTPILELTHIADSRLALPRIGSNTFARPAGTDWAWRPQLWRGALPDKGRAPAKNKAQLGPELTIFHDCQTSEISLRQVRNSQDHDLAAFGVVLEVFRFDGSFLSLVVDLPQEVCKGFSKRHLLRLGLAVDCEKPMPLMARLNVKHGPNTEQVLLTVPDEEAETMVTFDLGYSQLNEKRVERMWIDLICDGPQMNKMTIRDLNICRYPRAEI